ncbi:dixin-like isoform X4 [Solea senegalensis]|uniref:Dixin n=1 Tax=Solea senegalensis TaxID=28829 RepID=A0AAV6SHE9_SOLSE|nr:dixin-like isoform X1 [Solea senegalensis]KAG7515596.1 dixin-like isoform X4 [Solea senegalensis]
MIASLSRGSLLDEVLHGSFNEQQLAAYVSWVNSQLKRKPDLKPITDLRHDLQDGVVLTQLIEIVAGEVLEGIFVSPQNKEESRKNVEQVLQFISSRHIRMPHISAPDIVDGNLKSVMRIILALAAHFKPSANHRSATGSGRSMARGHAHNPLSTVALAQGAAAALASARFDAAQPSRVTRIHSGFGLDVEKNVCVRALVQQYERGSPDEHDSLQTNSSVSSLSHPRGSPSSHSHTPEEDCPEQQSSSQFCPATHQQSSGQFCPATHQQSSAALSTVVETTWEDSVSEALEKEVQETRRMVSALQNLLLHGSLPEDEKDVFFSLDQCNSEQQLIVIRSRLDQSMDEAQELKRELLRCKQELRNLQGVKVAQQQRLCTQEASILQMKQELLRASMTKDELNSQNAELQWKLEECNRLFSECKKETGQKDRLLQQLKHKLEESLQQQSELQRELQHISTSTENNGCSYSGNPAPSLSDAEEVQLLRDALRSLRNNFRDHDPQHHTLDTLEQGIASLMDRVHVLHTHRGRGKSPRHKGQHTDSDTKIPQSHGSGSSGSTKILYFTGKSPTPSMITIPKRLGEVTLKDVKSAVDQEGNYRYHFKALDPEFGTVKEEVYLDGATVPGWEGKIVAWVEEDCGDERPL